MSLRKSCFFQIIPLILSIGPLCFYTIFESHLFCHSMVTFDPWPPSCIPKFYVTLHPYTAANLKGKRRLLSAAHYLLSFQIPASSVHAVPLSLVTVFLHVNTLLLTCCTSALNSPGPSHLGCRNSLPDKGFGCIYVIRNCVNLTKISLPYHHCPKTVTSVTLKLLIHGSMLGS